MEMVREDNFSFVFMWFIHVLGSQVPWLSD